MTEHQFGGDWTEDKLSRIRDYLPAYTKIFQRHAYASTHYKTLYVDAFAGTGYRTPKTKIVIPTSQTLLDIDDVIEHKQKIFKGSAVIALETQPSFDKYIFIEKDVKHAQELESLKQKYPEQSSKITVVQDDAPKSLHYLCDSTDWSKWRAVVFLDPYGMQVDWELLKQISGTKAIDLWLLFPLGMAVNRLLTTKQAPPDKWAQLLDDTFGTTTWRSEFYAPSLSGGLFGDEEISGAELKNTNFDQISKFFVERLKTIFPEVAQPRTLLSSTNVPLFLLCFASHNKTAVKIARHILGK